MKSVERVCWWIHELILLRAEMDKVRQKRNLTRQDMATLQEISMDIHRVGRKIYSSVMDAYDTNGISLLSIKQSGQKERPVRESYQSPYRNLVDMIE